MNRCLSAVLLVLALALPTFAQSVKLPAEIKSPRGMILVAADTDCPEVQWVVLSGNLQVIPPDLLKNSKTAVCFAADATSARLMAIVAKGDKPAYAITTVIVGDPGPTPPPIPPPIPPPTDPLVKDLQAGYDRDKDDTQRVARLRLLTELMDEAANMAGSTDVKTLKQLNDAVRSVAEQKIGKRLDGALTNTRNAVGTYLNANLPTVTTPEATITDAERAKAKAVYQTVATALKAVRP